MRLINGDKKGKIINWINIIRVVSVCLCVCVIFLLSSTSIRRRACNLLHSFFSVLFVLFVFGWVDSVPRLG